MSNYRLGKYPETERLATTAVGKAVERLETQQLPVGAIVRMDTDWDLYPICLVEMTAPGIGVVMTIRLTGSQRSFGWQGERRIPDELRIGAEMTHDFLKKINKDPPWGAGTITKLEFVEPVAV